MDSGETREDARQITTDKKNVWMCFLLMELMGWPTIYWKLNESNPIRNCCCSSLWSIESLTARFGQNAVRDVMGARQPTKTTVCVSTTPKYIISSQYDVDTTQRKMMARRDEWWPLDK